MKKKLAFMIMGNQYNPDVHNACFETETDITYICTAQNFEEAYKKINELYQDGLQVLELCGAFGEDRAKEIRTLTNNEVAVGRVENFADQMHIIGDFFAGQIL